MNISGDTASKIVDHEIRRDDVNHSMRLGALAIGIAIGCLLSTPAAKAGDPFLRHTATVSAVKNAGPAVVNITTELVAKRGSSFRRFGSFGNDRSFDQFFRDFFEPRRPRTTHALGSGVIIDADRHVVTNHHVIERATRIHITMADGREFEATVIGADPNNDLAVLEVQTSEKLPWIPLGRSSDLLVGEPVIAIGNPFGLSNSVTTGVVSALNRSIRSEHHVFHGFLQTDASINPGNSGGALLNAAGELIGINTAVYNGGQGIGFAIPIDAARRVLAELIAHGEVAPVWVGLELQELDESLHDALELPRNLRGAVVSRVREKSPASRAGVKRGDVLTAVDERPLRSVREFFEVLDRATAGQRLRLEVWRNGDEKKLRLRAESVPRDLAKRLVRDLLGMELEALDRGGYVVRSVRRGGGAERIGLEPGDWLLAINGQALANDEALERSALKLRGRTRALIVVQRGADRYHLAIPLV